MAEKKEALQAKELPPKVIAIFEGFIKLRDEGVDLFDIKVSDIAKAAGIGKGTVYEYFTSKEEIIVKALIYESCGALSSLQVLIEETDGFLNKLDAALEWMSENVRKSVFVMQSLKKQTGKAPIAGKFCHNFMGEKTTERMEKIIGQILKAGAEEKMIRLPESKMEQDMISIAAAGAFMNYLTHIDYYTENTYEEAKRCASQILLCYLKR